MKISRITFTIDILEKGEKIASELLERRWIACVQVCAPIQSVYRWKGKMEHSKEWKFDLKTTLEGTPSVVQFIRENHSYEVPEILTEETISANPEFSQWILEECSGL